MTNYTHLYNIKQEYLENTKSRKSGKLRKLEVMIFIYLHAIELITLRIIVYKRESGSALRHVSCFSAATKALV